MNITNLWSVPIAESMIDIDIDATLHSLKSFAFERNDEINCDYTENKYILNDELFSVVANELKNEYIAYAANVLGYLTSDPFYHMDIKTSWGIRMNPGDHASRHYHAYSLVSGILYLNVDSSNRVVFHTPKNNNSFMRLPINHWNTNNCYEYSMEPEPGKLVLFPSYIDHHTAKNMSNESLHCISFDVGVKGCVGKGTTGEIHIME